MEPILSTKHLRRDCGGRGDVTHAADDVGLSVERGKFVGIMGVSRNEKSILLNCTATINTPIAGYIQVEGQDATTLEDRSLSRFRRERLGFVFRDCNLLDTFTAFENIALALTIQETPAREIGGWAKETAELLGVTDCLNKYPYQTSGGQCQRTTAAQAIIVDPTLVLVDEATGALDSRSARLLLGRSEAFNREGRATILMVTHSTLTTSHCRRVLLLQDDAVLTQLERGGQSRRASFQQIIGMVTRLGGDQSDAL